MSDVTCGERLRVVPTGQVRAALGPAGLQAAATRMLLLAACRALRMLRGPSADANPLPFP